MTRKETLIYFTVGLLNILAGIVDNTWLNYLTKPLLMILLAVFYYEKTKQNFSSQDKIMLVALLFSCFGDIFLMFQGQNPNFFLFGLTSFLVAQISYSGAFKNNTEVNYNKRFPFIAYSFILYMFLNNKIPKGFNYPILSYTLAITWMGINAAERKTNSKSYLYVLVGAITFIISDSLIAINKFAFAIPFAGFWIMATYIIAQYLIVEGILLSKKIDA